MAEIVEQLKIHRARIGKERDELRDLIGDFQSLADNCDTAFDDITHAIDTLSEQV